MLVGVWCLARGDVHGSGAGHSHRPQRHSGALHHPLGGVVHVRGYDYWRKHAAADPSGDGVCGLLCSSVY